VGLPARTAAAAVSQRPFYYHAWPRCISGNGWPMDRRWASSPAMPAPAPQRGSLARRRSPPLIGGLTSSAISDWRTSPAYGSFVAVDDLSLEVPSGVLYGLSRAQRRRQDHDAPHIAGILRPTRGGLWAATTCTRTRSRPRRARSFRTAVRLRQLTGAEFLRFVAALYGQEGDASSAAVTELLDVFRADAPGRTSMVEASATGCAKS